MPARQMTDLDRAAAAYIRARSGKLNLSQKDLSERSGISASTVHRYWNGLRSMSLGDLKTLINALDDTMPNALSEIERLTVELQ